MVCERNPNLLKDKPIYLHELVNNFYDTPRLEMADYYDSIVDDNEFIIPEDITEFDERVEISKNPLKGVFSGRTVVFQALQLAYYFGCRKIFIIGMDLGGDSNQVRFYDEGKSPVISKLDQDFYPVIEPAFKLASQFAKAESLNIYNLSVNSRLSNDIIPKISLDEALKLARNTE